MQLGRIAVQSAFRGLRTGDARLILIGAALLGFRWLRKPSGDALVYKQRLRPGDTVEIRLEPQER
ncbi:MAG: fumarylacetoacetate hydrolase family protein [Actinobacteria bacterium]|nr:fumarylacetoacetate hydrolase family protein [Actinomycetota bacterium]